MPGIMLVECIILRTDVLLLCVVLSVMRTFNQSAVFTFSHFQRRRFRSQGTGFVRPQRRKKKEKKKRFLFPGNVLKVKVCLLFQFHHSSS